MNPRADRSFGFQRCCCATAVAVAFVMALASSVGAQSISCGQTVNNTTTSATQVDTYTFTASAAGMVLITIGTAPSPGFDPVWRLKLGTMMIAGPDPDHQLVTLSSAGIYTIEVFDNGLNATGSYGLTIQGASASLTCGTAMSCGQTLPGNMLAVPGDTDSFSFEVLAGQAPTDVLVTIESASTGFSPIFNVYRPDGTFSGVSDADHAAVVCPTSGIYTIYVYENNFRDVGSYNLTLQGISESIACGASLSCGQTLAGNALAVEGDTETFNFEVLPAQAPSNVLVTIESTTVGFTPVFIVYQPDGTYTGVTSGEHASVACPVPGRYTIYVYENDFENTGFYNLTLQGIAERLGCGTPIQCGQTLAGNMLSEQGDTETFTFELLAGEAPSDVIVTIESTAVGFTPILNVYRPDGSYTGVSTGSHAAVACPVPGSYTIYVYENDFQQTGSFNLTLQGIAEPITCGEQLDCGQTLVGRTLSVPGDTETFTFELLAGEAPSDVLVTIASTAVGFSPIFQVYRPDGFYTGVNDGDHAAVDCPDPGIYTIYVYENDFLHTGSFNLTMQGIGQTNTCGEILLCGSSSVGNLLVPADTETFKFSVVTPGMVQVSISPQSNTVTPVANIYRPDGSYSGVSTSGTASLTAGVPGVYTIYVYDASFSGTGSYQVTLDAVTAVCGCPEGAASVSRNGTGVNPLTLVAVSNPVLGGSWAVDLDCSGHLPSVAFVSVRAAPATGPVLSIGEILCTGPRYLLLSNAHASSVVNFGVSVPNQLNLCGLQACVQGICFGSPGLQLSNALDVTIGM